MKFSTHLFIRQIQKVALTISLVLLFTSPLFAQRGWDHSNNDSAYFKHHKIHRINDTIFAHHINDSIFLHCRFDTALAHRIHEWNDTIYFHHRFDSALAYKWHNRIDSVDSIRHARFDSSRAHFLRRFDTICARHNWNDTISGDTLCINHWFDSILIRHHRNYIVFLHHLNLGIDKKSLQSDAMSAGSSSVAANNTIPVYVSIYPNPIDENAVLQITNSSAVLTFRLFDVTGRVVMSIGNLSDGNVELSRNNLPAGMYFYQVLNTNSVVSTGKLVIQ